MEKRLSQNEKVKGSMLEVSNSWASKVQDVVLLGAGGLSGMGKVTGEGQGTQRLLVVSSPWTMRFPSMSTRN